MSQKPIFNYFNGTDADLFIFYRIPKQLFTNDFFKKLSTDAKVLYGLMLDRMTLSIKNGWFDAENRAYIYFSVEDTMELLNCKKNKAVQTIAELDDQTGIGLIEKKRQGQGKPSVIYVKSFRIPEEKTDPEVGKTNFKNPEKPTSKGLQNKLPEVGKTNPNKNNNNDNDCSDNKSNLISSMTIGFEADGYAALIRDNIELDCLFERYPMDHDELQGIFDLILETVLCQGEFIVIASNRYPSEIVRSKFLKLNYAHIEYVMSEMRRNTTKVRNIRKYMLAALFNAPSTIESYYRAEVNHDMPQYAV